MAKKPEETVTKISKVRIEFHDTSATIIRGNGFPWISDKTENSVNWLVSKGYKPEEIEIIGTKPEYWDAAFKVKTVEQPSV